jgi:DNA-binding XRE family transcriptional regulator
MAFNRLTSRYLGGLVVRPAVIAMEDLQRLMEDAEMLADVKAYDAAKRRLENGEDELIPLEITERRLSGEAALRIWREHRKLTQERLAKKAKVSRALIAAIETKRKTGSVSTWKKLGAALDVGWEQLA